MGGYYKKREFKERIKKRFEEYEHNLRSNEDQSKLLTQITAALESSGGLWLSPVERTEYKENLRGIVEKRKYWLEKEYKSIFERLIRGKKIEKELHTIERNSKYTKKI